MPKPINEDKGTCPCITPGCDATARVRKERGARARLYLSCPKCGTINHAGAGLQEHILTHGALFGPAETVPAFDTVADNTTAVLTLPKGAASETKPAPARNGRTIDEELEEWMR